MKKLLFIICILVSILGYSNIPLEAKVLTLCNANNQVSFNGYSICKQMNYKTEMFSIYIYDDIAEWDLLKEIMQDFEKEYSETLPDISEYDIMICLDKFDLRDDYGLTNKKLRAIIQELPHYYFTPIQECNAGLKE